VVPWHPGAGELGSSGPNPVAEAGTPPDPSVRFRLPQLPSPSRLQQQLLLCLMPRLRLLLRLLLLLRLSLRLRLLLLLLLYLYLLHHPASQPAHLLALGGNTKMVVRDPIVQLSAHAVRFFAVVVTQVSLLLDRRMIRVRVNGAMASASRPSTRGGSLPKRLVFHHPFTTTGRRKAQISRRRHAMHARPPTSESVLLTEPPVLPSLPSS
jgi:hypothetical protein